MKKRNLRQDARNKNKIFKITSLIISILLGIGAMNTTIVINYIEINDIYLESDVNGKF